jgi:hypothetical protein
VPSASDEVAVPDDGEPFHHNTMAFPGSRRGPGSLLRLPFGYSKCEHFTGLVPLRSRASTQTRGVTRVRTVTCPSGGLAGPTTLPALLRLLGVDHEPVTGQRDAIMAWLADNAPSPELLVSLFANGYGLLLKLRSSRRAAV